MIWTITQWALGLIGAYIVIAGITYTVGRYIWKLVRDQARSVALTWPAGLVFLIMSLFNKEN